MKKIIEEFKIIESLLIGYILNINLDGISHLEHFFLIFLELI